MLEIQGIDTFYGLSQALFGIELELRQGEIVCLLGRNGAGKTTCLRSTMGLTPPRRGRIAFEGRDLLGGGLTRSAARGSVGFLRTAGSSGGSPCTRTSASRPNRARAPEYGPSNVFTGSSPSSGSSASTWARSSRAASSRCSPSAGRWPSTRGWYCSTSRVRGWRRLWCRASGRPSVRSARRAPRCSWSNRTRGSRSGTQTARTCSTTARVRLATPAATLLGDEDLQERYLGASGSEAV